MSCENTQLDICHVCDLEEQTITPVFTVETSGFITPFSIHADNLHYLWWESKPRGEYELSICSYCETCKTVLP